MISPRPAARAQLKLRVVLGAVVVMLFGAPSVVDAQGLVQGVREGAQAGNKAAGPVGGVLGGAIGGVVGVVTGVLGTPPVTTAPTAAQPAAKQASARKSPKAAKAGKAVPTATQGTEPPLTAEQIVANSDAYIERIKADLRLTLEQEKHWTAFNGAMHYLG